jgi:lysine-specific demethylase 8
MCHASSTNELRQFYTDSCILRALAQSILSLPLQAVATLDLAIIIAGAYGMGRMELILDAMTRVQSDIRQDEKFNTSLPPLQPKLYPYSVQTTIPCPSPLSFLSFQSTFSSAPFVLRNFAQSWPAFTDHPWRSASYLRSVAGPGRVVPVEIGTHYRLAEWRQDIVSWDMFLSLEFEDCARSATNQNVFYLAQHDLMKQFPSLRDDILVPDYIYSSLTAPEHHTGKSYKYNGSIHTNVFIQATPNLSLVGTGLSEAAAGVPNFIFSKMSFSAL